MTSDKKCEKFFKVLHERMKKAQQETKSIVSVNMTDIGNKPQEDKDTPDPGTKGKWEGRVQLSALWGGDHIYLCDPNPGSKYPTHRNANPRAGLQCLAVGS